MSASDNPNNALSKAMNDLKIDDSSLTLMDLNDDCLLHVLDYFKILELLNIRKVCRRFRDLADRCRHKFETFDTDNYRSSYPSKEKVYSIIKYIGPFLRKLKLHPDILALDIIEQYCPNVDNLVFKNYYFRDWSTMENFGVVVKQLKELELINCSFYEEIGECFDGASKLESLTITFSIANYLITNKFFEKISGLKNLKVQLVRSQIGKGFSKILIQNPDLEELVTNTCHFDTSWICDIVKLEPALKVIKLTFGSEMPSLVILADLPNLKCLGLHGKTPPKDFNSLMEKLGTKKTFEELEIGFHNLDLQNIDSICKMTNLKILSLRAIKQDDMMELKKLTHLEQLILKFCDGKTENALLDIINALQSLRSLKLPKTDITFKFIKELLEMLKGEAENRPKLMLEVQFVLDDMLDEDELKTLLKANNKILKMIYEVAEGWEGYSYNSWYDGYDSDNS